MPSFPKTKQQRHVCSSSPYPSPSPKTLKSYAATPLDPLQEHEGNGIKNNRNAVEAAQQQNGSIINHHSQLQFGDLQRQAHTTSSTLSVADIGMQFFGYFKNDKRNLVFSLGLPIQLPPQEPACCSLIDVQTRKRYRLMEHQVAPSSTASHKQCSISAHYGQELRLRIQNKKRNNNTSSANKSTSFNYCLLYQDSLTGVFYSLFPVLSLELTSVKDHFAVLDQGQEMVLSIPTDSLPNIDELIANNKTLVKMMLLCSTSNNMEIVIRDMNRVLSQKSQAVRQQVEEDSEVVVIDYTVQILPPEVQLDASAVLL